MRSHPCHVWGCTNVVVDPDFAWQMCDDCYAEACEIDNSEMPDYE